MATTGTTVWLQPDTAAEAAAGCGGCAPDASTACAARQVAPCPAPALTGAPDRLARVLQALRQVADADGNLVDAQRFSALHAGADEVTLTLTFPRGCGASHLLAEDAFQVLRRTLPDTDVYVLHAA